MVSNGRGREIVREKGRKTRKNWRWRGKGRKGEGEGGKRGGKIN